MSAAPVSEDSRRSGLRVAVESVGRAADAQARGVRRRVSFVGGLAALLGTTTHWCYRGMFVPGIRLRRAALAGQMVRIGTRAVPIVVLVQVFIGIILALQMAPTLESYGQLERVADVIAIAIVRELGPLITGIVLSGFAGASIAAEIGAMIESEEIKALRAHALNPFHFLVVPRFLATVLSLVGLAVIADVVGVFGGFLTGWWVLDVPAQTYLDLTREALELKDYLTGLFKAGVFGVLIAMIACYEGLHVSGGAVGVGRATTATVVKCIVALIGTDAVFTAVFYAWGI